VASGVANGNGVVVVYRLSWVAALTGLGLALLRVERLLRSTIDGLPWEVVLVAAAVLGGALTWAGLAYRLGTATIIVVNLAGMFLALVRITVPGTTWAIFPTLSSFGDLATELSFARDVIRTGVAPVIPLAGIVAILALVFWTATGLVVWGLLRSRPYVSVLTPLVLYLQFATMDRRPGGWWAWVFLAVLGFALLAVSFDRRREGTGLLTARSTRTAVVRTLPAVAAGILLAVFGTALWTTNAVAGLVPRSGLLEWRATSGLTGEYYGSVSYNPFVGIQQNLVSQTNVPVFVATVDGELSGDEVYWRLLTLDSFNGTRWFANDPQVSRPEDRAAYENPDQRFRGPSAAITQEITILALQMDWIPAVYAPTDMTAENRSVDRGFRVKEDDGSLRLDALTFRGMTYRVTSDVPLPDLQVLARDIDGSVSVVFSGAAEDEAWVPEPIEGEIPTHDLPERSRYLELPEGIDPAVQELAREQTRGLTTDFERAIALEAFFRTPGNFRYSTGIEPGHRAEELAAWLLDPASPNYRTGYCEQFSTSLAVMARMIGIPSRVVLGFTPGSVLDDGRVVVRDRNAHAWVELWMPAQGWVRFDPTPRGDGINPATTAELPFAIDEYLEIPEPEVPLFDPTDLPEIPLPEEFEDFGDIPPIGSPGFGESGGGAPVIPGWVAWVAVAAVVVFGLLPGLKLIRRRRRLRRLSGGDISAAWAEIVDRLSDLGAGPAFADTPMEYAAATDSALVPLAHAYGRFLYGPPRRPNSSLVAAAEASLNETEDRLTTRFSTARRVAAWYSPGTLAPRWWRTLRRRAR
jgi:hypothetical protein